MAKDMAEDMVSNARIESEMVSVQKMMKNANMTAEVAFDILELSESDRLDIMRRL